MKILEMAHGIIWGPWTVGIFLIVGLVSVRAPFFQILGFKYWWKATWGSLWGHGRGTMKRQLRMQGIIGSRTPVSLYCPGGNGRDRQCAGVVAAIVSGGPGAVFWMESCAGGRPGNCLW